MDVYYCMILVFIMLSGFANLLIICLNNKNRMLIKKKEWTFVLLITIVFSLTIIIQLFLLFNKKIFSRYIYKQIYLLMNVILTIMQGLIFIGLNKYVQNKSKNNISMEKELLKEDKLVLMDNKGRFGFNNDDTECSIFYYDLDEKSIVADKNIEFTLGYKKDELFKMRIEDIISKNELERVGKFLLARNTTSDVNTLMDLKKKNGQFIIASITGALIVKGDKKIIKGVIRDITDRVGIKQEVLRTNILLKDMLTNMEIFSFLVLDTSHRYLMMNKEHQKILKDKFDIDVKIAMNFNSILGAVSQKFNLKEIEIKIKENIEEALKGKDFTSILQIDIKGKKEYYQTQYGSIKDENGEIIGVALFTLNITENENIKSKLIEAKEKEMALNRAKSRFLANMSHEIRTPMNGIIGLTDILLNMDLDYDQKNYMNLIRQSAESLLSIINDILDLSKIESGKFVIKNEVFNFYKLIDKMKFMLVLREKDGDIEVKYEIEKGIPIHLFGDEIRLEQILMNLVGNAFKFTNEGEINIKISIDNDYIKCNRDKCIVLKFDVIDTGIGIEEKDIKSIFNSFTQIEQTYKKKYSGTGLGLTITKQLVEAMKGKLVIKSKIGEGSTFTFYLPFELGNYYVEVNNKIINETTNKDNINYKNDLKVLVAEDNEVNQILIKKLLSKRAVHIDIAQNGEEAIQALNKYEYKYDLIFMDISMPIMDGIEAMKIIKKNKQWCDIPIIALTAHALREDKEKFLELGMDDYLSKPIDSKELDFMINKYSKLGNEKNVCLLKSYNKKESITHMEKMTLELDDDIELVIELGKKVIFMFSKDQMKKIENCIEEGHIDELKKIVHRYDGAISNFGLTDIKEHLYGLYDFAYIKDLNGALNVINEIENGIKDFEESLKEYKDTYKNS